MFALRSIPRMEIVSLRYLVAVADVGCFYKAAMHLGVHPDLSPDFPPA